MFGSRFFWKVYGGSVALVVLTAIVAGVQLDRRVEEETLASLRTRLEEGAELVGQLIVSRAGPLDETELQVSLRRVGAKTGVRYTVVAEDGRVLADSDRDPASMESHADRPEITTASRGASGFSIRYSETLRTRMMYLALPGPPGSDAGWVRAAVPLRELDERLGSMRRSLSAAVAFGCAVGLVVGLLIYRSIARPLVEMSGAARAIAAGDVDRRLQVSSSDELGVLGRSFNLMAGELQERVAALEEDRNKLQAILAGMVEGVVAVDQEERVLHMNPVAARILGADQEPAIGRSLRSVTRVHEIADALSEAIRSQVDRTREILLPGYPGERVLEVHTGPIHGESDGLLGAVVVLHDVTELRRLEAVRRDFVANVSHELKTPLTAVRGILETVIEDPAMDDSTRTRFLRKVDVHSRRLTHIVSDLLNLTRAETRPEDIARESLDLRAPIRESCRALAAAAEERDIRLETELPDEEVRIEGDRPSLRLVVDNLIDNAVKYTPPGGRVSVRLRRNGEWALLEVTDTGIGIAEEHRSRLFERFYRVDKARSRELGGTGLGLSIVKHVSLALGGDVSFTSVVGEGSSFEVRLPLRGGSEGDKAASGESRTR